MTQRETTCMNAGQTLCAMTREMRTYSNKCSSKQVSKHVYRCGGLSKFDSPHLDRSRSPAVGSNPGTTGCTCTTSCGRALQAPMNCRCALSGDEDSGVVNCLVRGQVVDRGHLRECVCFPGIAVQQIPAPIRQSRGRPVRSLEGRHCPRNESM